MQTASPGGVQSSREGLLDWAGQGKFLREGGTGDRIILLRENYFMTANI